MIEITDVQITLAGDVAAGNEKLLAWATIELSGCFVIHNLRIIRSGDRVFVAMPSRKLANKCPDCSAKNSVIASYCNDCGGGLLRRQDFVKAHADVAHPINIEARDYIDDRVMEAYHDELALLGQGAQASRKVV